MDNETLTRVRAALNAQDVHLSRGSFLVKDLTKARAILTTLGVKEQDYLDAERRVISSVSETLPPHVSTQYFDRQFVNPILHLAPFWSDSDRKWFKDRFTIARMPGEGSPLIIVNCGDSKRIAVQVGQSTAMLRRDLAAAFSLTRPSNPAYKNMYEEMLRGISDTFNLIVRKFNKGLLVNKNPDKVKPPEMLMAEAMVNELPASMIRKYPIYMSMKKEAFQVGNETKSIDRPYIAWFDGPHGAVDAITHIAENLDFFMGIPEMCNDTMPEIMTNDPDVPAFHFVNLQGMLVEGPHPTWDTFFERFTPEEAKVFRAYVYSIFDAKNNGRQMLYIYDKDGHSGKSVAMRVIGKKLGRSLYTAIQKDSLSNQFGLAKLWDKRLVVIGDNKNPNLLLSEKIHMLLGGDTAEIEMKGKGSFSAVLNARVIASGNIPLEIDSSATHLRTRLIVVKPVLTEDILREMCKVENGQVVRRRDGSPVFIGDSSFEKRLEDEFEHMLFDARKDYMELCPNRSSIMLPEAMDEELDAMCSARFVEIDEWVENNFDLSPDSYVTRSDMKREWKRFTKACDEEVSFQDFVAHLGKRYGIELKAKYGFFNNHPAFFGVSFKAQSFEKELESREVQFEGMPRHHSLLTGETT